MIGLNLIGNEYKYEIENIIMMFFPSEKVSQTEKGDFCNITAKVADTLEVIVNKDGQEYCDNASICDNNELALCSMLFEILSGITNIRPEWGLQTGVRPTKVLRMNVQKYGLNKALSVMRDDMKISNRKLTLAYQTMKIQDELLKILKPNGYSLYVSIPFCKSRCSYCSFVSHDVTKSHKLIPEYVQLLCKEIEYTLKIANNLGLTLQSVYFGGGTPTAIDGGMLKIIDNAIRSNTDMSGVLEYTVEAGRPDTITREKLLQIKSMGADRISINPQTLNDEVLKNIGRAHTVKEFYDSFALAREIGFDNINTDLIAGLSGDTVDSFKHSLDEIINLSPESVTVHTLSVKRSSNDMTEATARFRATAEDVSQMVDYAREQLSFNEYNPYYMYRQSRQAGNLENVGYSKKGYESLYNMLIMEEVQTIFAVGAGASTKIVQGNQIDRIFNYKYPYEYISGFDEMLNRKDKIYQFFDNQVTGL